MDLRVQRLHPTVEHLGEAGDLLDRRHRDARLAQRRRRPTRGDDRDAELVEAPRELDRPACRRPPAAPGGRDGRRSCRPCSRRRGFAPRSPRPTPRCCASATGVRRRRRGPRRARAPPRGAAGARPRGPAPRASPSRRPGRTGIASCSTIGPWSTSSSTRWTVTPVTFTPHARASATEVVPGKGREQRGMHVQDPPVERADEPGAEDAHETGERDDVDRGDLAASRGGLGRRRRGPVRPRVDEARPRPPDRARSSARASSRSDTTSADPCADHRVVEERLEVGPLPRREHRDPCLGHRPAPREGAARSVKHASWRRRYASPVPTEERAERPSAARARGRAVGGPVRRVRPPDVPRRARCRSAGEVSAPSACRRLGDDAARAPSLAGREPDAPSGGWRSAFGLALVATSCHGTAFGRGRACSARGPRRRDGACSRRWRRSPAPAPAIPGAVGGPATPGSASGPWPSCAPRSGPGRCSTCSGPRRSPCPQSAPGSPWWPAWSPRLAGWSRPARGPGTRRHGMTPGAALVDAPQPG